MQAGFICYEVGFVQSKNVISVAIENIIAFVIATLSYYLIGFTLMFGFSYAGFIGTNNWLLFNVKNNYDYIFVFYQLMFAGTAVTIFSGSMSERTRLKALVAAAIVVGVIIYPVFGHWVWGGMYINQPTFLSRLGYIDYAGATVVHATAGWIALAGIIVVGPRSGRWDKNEKPKRLGRSNIPFAVLGTFILWFSWFGFNGGNLLRFEDRIGLTLLNTNIAASAGVVGAVITTLLIAKNQSFMEAIFNGALGGLVAITAGSDILTPDQAILVGLITGSAVVLGSLLLLKLKIDDAVNAVPIHAFGGVCGALLCSLFASPQYLNHTSRVHQLLIQLLGVSINFLWSFGIGLFMFYVINKTIGLRVSPEEEEKGLNIVEFSDVYTWLQNLKDEHYENLTQDLYDKIRQQNTTLKRQADMLVVTQEREREKIARDLHDGVGQSLVALKINLGLIHNKTDSKELKNHSGKTMMLIENTIEEIRNVIYNLKPVELEKDGLPKSIRSLCEKLGKLSRIKFNCNVTNDLPKWNETEELNIYRIIQECLTNIIKHSYATEADLLIIKLNGRLFLITIIDNGRGFDMNNVKPGLGLTAIRERAAMLNAKITIDSEEGWGTKIMLEVPYEKNQSVYS